MKQENLKLVLCQGRHEIPQAADGNIFPNTVDPTDIKGLKDTVKQRLEGASSVELYVTGLSVALVEVVIYCQEQNIGLTLYHYNSATGEYYPQEAYIADKPCPWCGGRWYHGSWYCSNCGSN